MSKIEVIDWLPSPTVYLMEDEEAVLFEWPVGGENVMTYKTKDRNLFLLVSSMRRSKKDHHPTVGILTCDGWEP